MAMSTRRLFCLTAAGGAALSLSRCGVVAVTKTDVTVNVADLENYVQAGINFAELVTPLLNAVTGVPEIVVLGIGKTETALQNALTSFRGSTPAGSVTLSIDTSSVSSTISTLYTDLQTLQTEVVGAVGATISDQLRGYLVDLNTIDQLVIGLYNQLTAVKAAITTDTLLQPRAVSPSDKDSALRGLNVIPG